MGPAKKGQATSVLMLYGGFSEMVLLVKELKDEIAAIFFSLNSKFKLLHCEFVSARSKTILHHFLEDFIVFCN